MSSIRTIMYSNHPEYVAINSSKYWTLKNRFFFWNIGKNYYFESSTFYAECFFFGFRMLKICSQYVLTIQILCQILKILNICGIWVIAFEFSCVLAPNLNSFKKDLATSPRFWYASFWKVLSFCANHTLSIHSFL